MKRKRVVYHIHRCPHCNALVATNWYLRHVRSSCTIGAKKAPIHKEKNEPTNRPA
jgi:hypothetical protein